MELLEDSKNHGLAINDVLLRREVILIFIDSISEVFIFFQSGLRLILSYQEAELKEQFISAPITIVFPVSSLPDHREI